ncbi:phage tail tape measure protein [Acinetobacter johnsonii]|uniref:phage tail tape measure protein n=1 Tax=Acinetobacter johnsonii TaxID=40214 RepID=UPI003D16C783
MAQAGVIRDFMVALGFKTDNTGLKQMQDAMGGVELKAAALKGALFALATGAVVAVRQTASELDKLYFSSQRIGASVTNINAYGNAIAQLGGSAEGAIGSLESLAEKMRNSPGYESQINSLGVQTKDANGAMRDRVEVMKDLSGVLSKMPSHQANAYASSLGIDQNTLLAMRDGKFVSNMDKYQKIQKELGMNDDLAKSGNEFMSEYRDLTMMTKTGFQVIVMQAGKALIPILKLLNTLIMAGISAFSQLNPQIKEGLGIALRFGMAALILGAFIKTFGMIFKFIPMLKGFIGLLKLFRLAFLASPIGIILALASALYLLYDDYKTWRDGGKSLFDWSKWTNGIDKIIAKIKDFLAMLEKVKDKVVNFVQKIISDPIGAVQDVVETAKDVAKDAVENITKPTKEPANETVAKINEVSKNIVDSVKETTKKAVDVAVGVAKAVQGEVKGAVAQSSSKYSFSFGKDVDKYIKEASIKYGIDEKILRGFVKMEAGWTGKMSPTGAIGTGQFVKGTWDGLAKTKDGKDIGMTKIGKRFRTSADPRYNKRVNTLATGLLAKQNADILKKYNIPVTGENLYLAHNIGAVTFAKALTGKGANSDGLLAMRQNGMKKSETPKQFVKRQAAIYQKHYKTANQLADPVKPPSTPKNPKELAKFAQNAEVPNGNPHKSQVSNSSNMTASNVTIHQSFKTDMTLNGVSSPMESANAVKRQQENQLAFMARNAMSPLSA